MYYKLKKGNKMIRFILLVACILVVMNMAFKDEVEQDSFYTDMVCDGTWPNYKNLEIYCKWQNPFKTKQYGKHSGGLPWEIKQAF